MLGRLGTSRIVLDYHYCRLYFLASCIADYGVNLEFFCICSIGYLSQFYLLLFEVRSIVNSQLIFLPNSQGRSFRVYLVVVQEITRCLGFRS